MIRNLCEIFCTTLPFYGWKNREKIFGKIFRLGADIKES